MRIVLGRHATDYHVTLGRIAAQKFEKAAPNQRAAGGILIGAPQYNAETSSMLCVEDALRLKYDSGLAAFARAEGDRLLICGLSDYGDAKLIDWLNGV